MHSLTYADSQADTYADLSPLRSLVAAEQRFFDRPYYLGHGHLRLYVVLQLYLLL